MEDILFTDSDPTRAMEVLKAAGNPLWQSGLFYLNGSRTQLDLGSNTGCSLRGLDPRTITCIEKFPAAAQCLRDQSFQVIEGDAVRILPDLVCQQKQFDRITLFDFIEHLSRSEGEALLHAVESLAIREILLFVPLETKDLVKSHAYQEFMSQMFKAIPPEQHLLQQHRSRWTPEDFTSRRYQVTRLDDFHMEGFDAFFAVKYFSLTDRELALKRISRFVGNHNPKATKLIPGDQASEADVASTPNPFNWAALGPRSKIINPILISNPENIFIGDRVLIRDGARLEAIKKYAGFTYDPSIRIEDGVSIELNVHIGAANRVHIGKNTMIAGRVTILDHDHGYEDPFKPPYSQPLKVGTVFISEDVWIGENVCICKNVRIGKHAVIGANSLVAIDIPPFTVAVGNPIRIIKVYHYETKRWEAVSEENLTSLLTQRDKYLDGLSILGQKASEAEQIDQAIDALTELVYFHSDRADAYNDLGVLLLKKGDRDGAFTLLKEGLVLEPANTTILKNLADFYFCYENKLEDALTIYQRILYLSPDDPEALTGIGNIASALGKEKEEILIFNRVHTVDKKHLPESEFVGESKSLQPQILFEENQPGKELKLYRLGNLSDYFQYISTTQPLHEMRDRIERSLVIPGSEEFKVSGFCSLCGLPVHFHVDYFAANESNGVRLPNWRERLLCPSCGLNNRMRAAIHILSQFLKSCQNPTIYIAEQTTPVYLWIRSHYPKVIGSEYLGQSIPFGSTDQHGIRNEDITALTFPDQFFNLVVTFDVFEHIADYRSAFRECWRTLKEGGTLFFSVPFVIDSQANTIRAKVRPNGSIEYILSPEYHGDPLNSFQGCLCFQVFGWEMIEELKSVGFDDACAYIYWSRDLGYLGGDQIVFAATKNKEIQNQIAVGHIDEALTSHLLQTHMDRVGSRMKEDWNTRAEENVKYYIHSSKINQSEEEFDASGKKNVQNLVVDDLPTITGRIDPKTMIALEIGCGVGRMTRHLAGIFKEIHGVDVAGNMIREAKSRLEDLSNAHCHETNGTDLSIFPDEMFDFAFSFIVFQHIPSKEVILNYIRDAHRVLKTGCVFKFQVQGCTNPNWMLAEKDTWHGVTITEDDVEGISQEVGFDLTARSGQGTQYSWYTLKKSARASISKNQPMVSVVIPVFNKLEYTRQCLTALGRHTPDDLYEVIIVDNNSTDGTQDYLPGITGNVKIITNQENRGFTIACNQGAREAQGKYIVFLNNDTEPQPGWLDALIETMDGDASVGIAGSKLLSSDGGLQEAGGIIFRDGSGWNYGRFDDPDHPRYQCLREVDYVSGASLLIRRSLLEDLQYFDEQYSPGYYEDTDLCFQARSAGYKVVYCPFSRVIHHEGISSGTDLSRGMKKYQAINKEKFAKKWAPVLKSQFPPDPKNVVSASERGVKSNILIVDPFLPMFDRASGSQRLFQMIKLVRRAGHHVTFIARNGTGQEAYARLLEKMGVEVYATDPQMMRRLGYLTEGREVNLEELFRTRRYHYAVLSFYDIAIQYLPPIRTFSPDTKIFIDTVDIHFLREARMAALENNKSLELRARATQQAELAIYRQADAIITVTENDWQAIQDFLPGKPHGVIPNIHEVLASPSPFSDRQGLLFVGNFNHTPNGDAVRYFAQEIFPLVKEQIPEVTLTIVGNNPPEDLRKLSNPDLQFTGYVPFTLPHLQKARVAVVPLRYGAGMKGKVGESLAHGLPVVSTSIGAEGMGLTHGENILIADTPGEFARQIGDLYLNQTLWENLSTQGQRKVRELWSPEKVSQILAGIFPVHLEVEGEPAKPKQEKEGALRLPFRHQEKAVERLSSIIIPAKDNWEYTRLCLDSLVRYADVPYELIIVDNGSSVSFRDQLSTWKKKNPRVRLKYLRSNKNLGFAGGCNKGIQISAGDFIVFLNNDTVVTPGLFSTLLKPLMEKEEVGITGPVSNFVAGAQMISINRLKFAGPEEADIEEIADYAHEIRERFKGRMTPTNNLVGLCLALKKEVVQTIGGFDERFYPGNFEDVDYCVRAVQKGFKLMICQDAFLYHFGNRTFLNENGDYRYFLTVNLEKFQKKWGLNGFKSENELYEIPIANRTYPKEFFHYPITNEQQAYIYSPNGHSVFMGEVLKTYLENSFMWSSRLIIPCNGQEPAEIQEKIETFLEEEGLRDNGDIVIFSGNLAEVLEGLEGERCLISSWAGESAPAMTSDDVALVL